MRFEKGFVGEHCAQAVIAAIRGDQSLAATGTTEPMFIENALVRAIVEQRVYFFGRQTAIGFVQQCALRRNEAVVGEQLIDAVIASPIPAGRQAMSPPVE